MAQCEKLRGPGGWPPALRGKVAGAGVSVRGSGGANNKRSKQLVHRLPAEFVRRVLKDFNQGVLGAADAAARLEVSRARLYQLRTGYLRDKAAYCPQSSGGARREQWPAAVIDFLTGFLPLQSPPNYQLVADELLRLCQFRRARSTVEAYVKAHLPHLVATPPARPKGYRRFRRAHVGELWQHDSSLHQWWPAASKQTLVLSIDDCSGLCVAGSFVERDTTWAHFLHFRKAFEQHGLPEAAYTDALSLFGPSSSHDHTDPRSEFQRALRALGVAHLVAPSAQAKGKIERGFGTFQKRLVTLLDHAGIRTWQQADEILQMEINRRNRTVNRSTAKVPIEVWEHQILARTARLRPCPPASLLDLHLSLRTTRRVNPGYTIDFDGTTYEIAPTTRKIVTALFHPRRKLWVLEQPPKATWPKILGHFTL